MNTGIDETHAPALKSWLESANDPGTDFPIQNLPFGRFRRASDMDWRIGVAIGDQVLDLRRAKVLETYDMNRLMRLGSEPRQAIRAALSAGLRHGSPYEARFRKALVPQTSVEMGLPCEIGGQGDASSIGVGGPGLGHSLHRPAGASASPNCRLDFELELGVFISRPNVTGEPVSMADAEEHVFGLALLTGWSAGDIGASERRPSGALLSKNFANTVSPWMVTRDALAPFRKARVQPAGQPVPPPRLDSAENRERGAIEVKLEVWLQTEQMRLAGHAGDRLVHANYGDAYRSVAQLVAQHTATGRNLRSGDMVRTGTLPGIRSGEGGSLLERSQWGAQPIRLSDGEVRTCLEDGDTVILRGHCERRGYRRIGFGECRGTVLPARAN